MDDWHFCSYELRKFLRGWGHNRAAEARKQKSELLGQVSMLDAEADAYGLSAAGWQQRYDLEALLMQLHRQAEVYWRQRGTINWTLKGDSLTAYFFAIANGRRRRCSIDSLLVDGVRVDDPRLILNHVHDFFAGLLAARPASGLVLASDFWGQSNRVSLKDNLALSLPLSVEEIELAINSANLNSASGPDGFSISFFRRFWPALRSLVCAVIQGFCLGTVDISRL